MGMAGSTNRVRGGVRAPRQRGDDRLARTDRLSSAHYPPAPAKLKLNRGLVRPRPPPRAGATVSAEHGLTPGPPAPHIDRDIGAHRPDLGAEEASFMRASLLLVLLAASLLSGCA